MEFWFSVLNVVLILILLALPILFFIRNKKSNTYFGSALATFFKILIFPTFVIYGISWWFHYQNILLLEHYHAYWFNPNNNSYQVDYTNVAPENLARVKQLETSIMGIGWPLKAVFFFLGYAIYGVLILIGFTVYKLVNQK